MNQSGKKLGIILFLLLWFILISIPAFAILLATREQIQLGEGDSRLRIFLLQERDAEGIGIELVRPFDVESVCNQTEVRYLMWRGTPENVIFCQCFELPDNASLPATWGPCISP